MALYVFEKSNVQWSISSNISNASRSALEGVAERFISDKTQTASILNFRFSV